jgi:N-formylglutamate deformylase
MPHVGIELPTDISNQMTATSHALDDTDWHIETIYRFAIKCGASYLQPTYSRYVVDLNRPADGSNLYPGQNTTGLCPLTTFDGEPLYQAGCEPSAEEIEHRLSLYWQPYHDALAAELARIKAIHGYALLWDAHSIRSKIPRLFEAQLPVFNFGCADGASCDAGIAHALLATAKRLQPDWPAVLNGRFKGGYITRHYGNPTERVHAMQLELAQRSYMEEVAPYRLIPDQLAMLEPVLQALIEQFMEFQP